MQSGSNLPIITVDMLSSIVEKQFKENNFRPIFALGKGGIGKTECIKELAEEKLKIGYIDIRLLLYSETDLKGIPYPNKDHTRTIWLQNDILPTVERDGEEGILVLDEITSCAKSVRTAAYQLLNERKLGEYVLPDRWMIVCLGNGEEDGGDYQGMEGNFANRCSVYHTIPDLDAWKNWAFKHGINELVSSYVSFKPGDLHSYNPDNETEMLFASPRSWTAVSNILNICEYDKEDRILHARIIANLGQRVGQQFISFCKFKEQTVDPNRIVINGEKPKLTNNEIIYITIQSVIKIVAGYILKDLEMYDGKVTLNTIKYMAHGLRWILSLKTEYAVMGFKDLIAYNENIKMLIFSPELSKECPELREFAIKNERVFI